MKNCKARTKNVAKGLRSGFKEFYSRVAATTYYAAEKYFKKEGNITDRKFIISKEED